MTWLSAIALVVASLWLGNQSSAGTVALMDGFAKGQEPSTLRIILWGTRIAWVGTTAAAVCAGLLFARA